MRRRGLRAPAPAEPISEPTAKPTDAHRRGEREHAIAARDKANTQTKRITPASPSASRRRPVSPVLRRQRLPIQAVASEGPSLASMAWRRRGAESSTQTEGHEQQQRRASAPMAARNYLIELIRRRTTRSSRGSTRASTPLQREVDAVPRVSWTKPRFLTGATLPQERGRRRVDDPEPAARLQGAPVHDERRARAVHGQDDLTGASCTRTCTRTRGPRSRHC